MNNEESNIEDGADQVDSLEKKKSGGPITDEKSIVEKLILSKYQSESIDTVEKERKLGEEGYGGARRKRSRRSIHQRQKQWRDSSLTRTPPVKSAFIHPSGETPFSEPSHAIRGPSIIGSPPSYKRFDSPKPPPVVKVKTHQQLPYLPRIFIKIIIIKCYVFNRWYLP